MLSITLSVEKVHNFTRLLKRSKGLESLIFSDFLKMSFCHPTNFLSVVEHHIFLFLSFQASALLGRNSCDKWRIQGAQVDRLSWEIPGFFLLPT